MAWMIDDARIASAAMMPAVREAAERGGRPGGRGRVTDAEVLFDDDRSGGTL